MILPEILILAPISVGELFDKISILMLKAEHLVDPEQLSNVVRELDALRALKVTSGLEGCFEELFAGLAAVNRCLWGLEDELRGLEAEQRFDSQFIAAARSVYRCNDQRAALKRQINLMSGSRIMEEKSHPSPVPSGL